jgi:CheY-like chemotaxis protein
MPQASAREDQPALARRILVVDDNRDAAASLAMLLQLTGNQTETAFDGLAAIEVAASFKPDVVLLDIGLPGLNGYEVARRIRQEPWGKAVKLVAVTGWGQLEDRQRSKEAGFDAHMVKPVDHDLLAKILAA